MLENATNTARDIFGRKLTQQPHSHEKQWMQMFLETGSQGTAWTLLQGTSQPLQWPSTVPPVCSRAGSRGICPIFRQNRALRGAARLDVRRTISAEDSNSCIVSDHLSTTTPCQYAERNAETSTVPLDTHLFFRVNFPELLCKLLARRTSSWGLCFVCVL